MQFVGRKLKAWLFFSFILQYRSLELHRITCMFLTCRSVTWHGNYTRNKLICILFLLFSKNVVRSHAFSKEWGGGGVIPDPMALSDSGPLACVHLYLHTRKKCILNKLCTSGESHPGIIIFKILSSFLNNVQRRTNKCKFVFHFEAKKSYLLSKGEGRLM